MNSDQNHRPIRNILILAFGATCVSFAAIFVKMIDRDALGPTAIGFWRTLFGSAILFVWVAVSGKSVKLPKPILVLSLLAGFLFYLDLFFWHRSIIYAGAGMATILANTQVFWLAIFGFFLFKERLSLVFALAVVAAFAGVTMLVGVGSEVDFSSIYIEGVIFGLLTGVVYGAYLLTLKTTGHRAERPSFLTLMAWISLFTAVFCGISMLIESDPYVPPDTYSIVVLLSLALVAQALGWFVISSSLPRLRASQSGLILLLQPVLATVWGVLFFAEQLTPLQIAGAAITLVAIYIGSVRKKSVG